MELEEVLRLFSAISMPLVILHHFAILKSLPPEQIKLEA